MKRVDARCTSLDHLGENPGDNEALADVASVLREVRATLMELQEQVAGRTKDFYTVEEVGQMTGRAPYTVRSWIREGRIHAQRIEGTGPKGRLLVPRAELEKLVAAGKGQRLTGITAK